MAPGAIKDGLISLIKKYHNICDMIRAMGKLKPSVNEIDSNCYQPKLRDDKIATHLSQVWLVYFVAKVSIKITKNCESHKNALKKLKNAIFDGFAEP